VTVAADVLLWRNKKISSSVLGLATAIWVFFEWLDYHFLTIISFVLVLGMVVQFVWSNFSSKLNGYAIYRASELCVFISYITS
jgi:Na+-translocating ferredoxin:NAD+ oxidoreductase RnfA subunit